MTYHRAPVSGILDNNGENGFHGSGREAVMNRTGIVQDAIFMEHVMDRGHPESPERLKVIYEMLEDEEKKSLRLIKVTPRPATREELETTHSPALYRSDCVHSRQTSLQTGSGHLNIRQIIRSRISGRRRFV